MPTKEKKPRRKDRIQILEDDRMHVYLASAGRFIKIGVSADPEERMVYLSTSCPEKPVLISHYPSDDAREIERAWHVRLARYNTNGEWFDLPPRLRSVVTSMIQDGDVPLKEFHLQLAA